MPSHYSTTSLSWAVARRNPRFRRMLIAGVTLLVVLLALWPYYLQRIEQRKGVLLNDWVLAVLPVRDVSIPIFIILWPTALLIAYRAIRSPAIFLTFIWCYALLFLARMLTIGLVPLDPPTDLVVLVDPLSNYFYGQKFITKDLFFSGHTASICLIGLCLEKPTDRLLAGIGTLLVGILLLVQRVHYTADVLAAPFFTYATYWLGRQLTAPALSIHHTTTPDKPGDR